MRTPRLFFLGLAVVAAPLPSSGRAGERLLFDGEVTLTAKETAFPSLFSDLTAPDDFRAGSLHVRYEVLSLAAAGPTVALQCCLKAPDGAHTCVTCVSVTKPGTYTIDRPLAKMFKSAPITYDQLTSLVLVAKAERCNNHDEPSEPLKAQYFPLRLRATVVAVPTGATFSGWENYPSRPEAALQLWLRLDETSGPSAADASAHHREHSSVQGARWSNDLTGRGLEFDGEQSFVALPPLEGFPDGLTLSTRALPRSVKKAARFIELSNGRANDNIIFGRRLATDALEFEAFAGGKSCGLILAPGVIEHGRWHRYSATVDPAGVGLATVTLYRDGDVVKRTDGYPFPPVVARTANQLARSQWAQDEFFHGALADIRIYSRALTAAEVAHLP